MHNDHQPKYVRISAHYLPEIIVFTAVFAFSFSARSEFLISASWIAVLSAGLSEFTSTGGIEKNHPIFSTPCGNNRSIEFRCLETNQHITNGKGHYKRDKEMIFDRSITNHSAQTKSSVSR